MYVIYCKGLNGEFLRLGTRTTISKYKISIHVHNVNVQLCLYTCRTVPKYTHSCTREGQSVENTTTKTVTCIYDGCIKSSDLVCSIENYIITWRYQCIETSHLDCSETGFGNVEITTLSHRIQYHNHVQR